MSQSAVAAFLRDPVTVSRKELIEHYRAQTARYKELAERQNPIINPRGARQARPAMRRNGRRSRIA